MLPEQQHPQLHEFASVDMAQSTNQQGIYQAEDGRCVLHGEPAHYLRAALLAAMANRQRHIVQQTRKELRRLQLAPLKLARHVLRDGCVIGVVVMRIPALTE
jgi:hypothetical protein